MVNYLITVFESNTFNTGETLEEKKNFIVSEEIFCSDIDFKETAEKVFDTQNLSVLFYDVIDNKDYNGVMTIDGYDYNFNFKTIDAIFN